MKVYSVQLNTVWENKPATYERARKLVLDAQPVAGSLIVLPETFSTGFSCNLPVTAQSGEREDEAFLSQLAQETKCTITAGIVSRINPQKGCNESVTFGTDGKLVARYRKIHPFSMGGELDVHQPGTEIVTFELNGFTVAPFVCYDLRFPEIFRSALDKGVNLFVVIANWPVKRDRHWTTLLQARAIENLAYVVGVNRCGTDPNFFYSGRSLVVDPHGIIISDAGGEERVVTTEIDLDLVQNWRRDFPPLRDRHWK
ncbi:MAG TPA: carbon-nitrogen family hydrolase [Verrucomicrobiae bacterium]